MKTTKIDTNSIFIDDDQSTIKTFKIESEDKSKNGSITLTQDLSLSRSKAKITSLVTKIVILTFLLFALTRIPFLGSYLDGLIDYVFGWTKYIFYLAAIIFLLTLIFNFKLKCIIKTWKFLIFFSIFLFCIGCVISGCRCLVNKVSHDNLNDIINNYHINWLSYFKVHSYNVSFFNLKNIDGGILPVIFTFIFDFASYIILVIIAIIIGLISIFIILNINYKNNKVSVKIRKWLVKKLGGNFDCDYYDELKHNKSKKTKIKKLNQKQIETLTNSDDKTSLLALLPETTEDNYQNNKKFIDNCQKKLDEYFQQNKINAIVFDTVAYATYSEAIFHYEKQETIEKIMVCQNNILKLLKINEYNLTYKKNKFSIQIANINRTKNSIRRISNQIKNFVSFDTFFSLDKSNKPFIFNIAKNGNTMIIGKKYSGSATLMVSMLLSLCISTNPQSLDLLILSPNIEPAYQSFKKIAHTDYKIFDEHSSIINVLNDLNNEINTRKNLISMASVSDYEQYNRSKQNESDKIKVKVVAISSFDLLTKNDFRTSKLLIELLKESKKVGIFFILQSLVVNNETYSNELVELIDSKFILKLNDEYESNMIFNNYAGLQLYGNGDTLFFTKDSNDTNRLQGCYITKDELDNDLDIVENFYKKQEGKSQTIETVLDNSDSKKIYVEDQVQESKEE